MAVALLQQCMGVTREQLGMQGKGCRRCVARYQAGYLAAERGALCQHLVGVWKGTQVRVELQGSLPNATSIRRATQPLPCWPPSNKNGRPAAALLCIHLQ